MKTPGVTEEVQFQSTSGYAALVFAFIALLMIPGGIFLRLPFVSVLTDPSTAGVLASYASLGDLIIAEPDALIGFAGPRVIEQTIRQQLPPGFQRSEFLLEHGMVDMVVPRNALKSTLERALRWFERGREPDRRTGTAADDVAEIPATD